MTPSTLPPSRRHLLLFDTSSGTDNLGDFIIMRYCEEHLREVFAGQDLFVTKVPTHLPGGAQQRHLCTQSRHRIVCGTNILKTSILRTRLWKLSPIDGLTLRNLCLMGVGWGSWTRYAPDPYTAWMYRSILAPKRSGYLHSVRDSYTQKRLQALGFTNVLNTACPTMWHLTPEHLTQIPSGKARQALITLTYYRADPVADKAFIRLAKQHYARLYFWPQQARDLDYLVQLGEREGLTIVDGWLEAYDALLQQGDLDYLGSRLHGGIHALNHRCRTLILGVDNRAVEIAKDTGLPVVNRQDLAAVEDFILRPYVIRLSLPWEAIAQWKQQFSLQ